MCLGEQTACTVFQACCTAQCWSHSCRDACNNQATTLWEGFYLIFAFLSQKSSSELNRPLPRRGRRRCSLCCCLSSRWSAGRTGCRSLPAGRWHWGSRFSSRLLGPSPWRRRTEKLKSWTAEQIHTAYCRYMVTHCGHFCTSGWIDI